ncbi:MAG: hypothetical protein WKF62_02760 [Solirubrobacterales bacterium]
MEVISPPEKQDPTDELDALIEEARRRARRRRIASAAAAAVIAVALGGTLLFIGGNDGGGSSGTGDSSGPGGSGAANEANAPASTALRCPTSLGELRAGPPPGRGIPGCRVKILADLPEGWVQRPASLTVFPPQAKAIVVSPDLSPFRGAPNSFERGRALGQIALLGQNEVQFANFPLRDPLRPGADVIPMGGIRLSISSGSPGAGGSSSQTAFEAQDFRISVSRPRATAQAPLALDGIDFRVRAEIAANNPSPELLAEANAILSSLSTDQKLCPCELPDIRHTLARLDEAEEAKPPRKAR